MPNEQKGALGEDGGWITPEAVRLAAIGVMAEVFALGDEKTERGVTASGVAEERA
jgi:hypothetical protein